MYNVRSMAPQERGEIKNIFRLHFRRDVFPLRWHPEKDRPAARLVFAQVCSSIKNGENATKNVRNTNVTFLF